MKRKVFSLAIFTFIFLQFACEKDNSSEKTDADLLPKVKSSYLIAASNQFTFEILKKVDSTAKGHNFFISPFSAQQALSMTLNGANGQTYSEMEKVLGFENEGLSNVNDYNQSLVSALTNADPKVNFQIANSIWALKGYPIEQAFFDVNQKYYDAEVKTEDFTHGTLQKINSWCEEKTNGKVKEVLDYIDPNAMMYLINALYFKGSWKYEFDKSKTAQKTFYKADGSEVMHDQMAMEATVDFYQGTDFSMLALPYGEGGFRMLVLLPTAGKTNESIIASMNTDSWKNALKDLKPQKIVVKIPKFKFEFKSLLNPSLESMGMKKAFTDSADFTGISKPGGIYISRVIHQTFVEVNEEGSEAAAVTVVEIIYKTNSPGNEIPTFEANRPFLYFIEEKSTGAVIFAGRMNDPTEKKYEIK